MNNCCHNKEKDLAHTAKEHKNILWTVLFINLAMFFVEIIYGWISNSNALVADSLDMFGDAVTYGTSLLVVESSLRSKAKVAKLKAWIMFAFGIIVSAKCIYRGLYPATPDYSIMLGIGGLALIANIICLLLLTRHKADDINMKSVWICSRNDIIANCSVLLAAGIIYITNSAYPDIVVGLGLAILFTYSSIQILKEANAVS